MLNPAMSPVKSPFIVMTFFFVLCAPPSPYLGRQRRMVKRGECYSRKIMTMIIRTRHLVLRSLETYWSTRV